MYLVTHAAVLNSNQVGTNPVNGYCLTTNGATSTWSSSCGSGGGGSSTVIYAGTSTVVNASGTNGYIISNIGVTSLNGATGTITLSIPTSTVHLTGSSTQDYYPSWLDGNGNLASSTGEAGQSLSYASGTGYYTFYIPDNPDEGGGFKCEALGDATSSGYAYCEIGFRLVNPSSALANLFNIGAEGTISSTGTLSEYDGYWYDAQTGSYVLYIHGSHGGMDDVTFGSGGDLGYNVGDEGTLGVIGISTLATTTVTDFTNAAVKNALVLDNGSGHETAYGGSSCTNQGVSGISATGTVTCTTFATSTSGSTSVTSTQFAFGNPSNLITSSGTFTTQSFDTIKYADQFSGADIGAQINAAYAACPSNGCEIVIPQGTWSYSTGIVIGTNGKPALLYCPVGGGFFDNAGTVLNYTGSGSAYSDNTNNFAISGMGITNCSFVGPAGNGNIGSSTVTSSYGISLGGGNGAFGWTGDNIHVSGFGTGVYVTSSVSFMTIENSTINKNGQDLYQPNASGANGENNRVLNSVLADSNASSSSIAANCVQIAWNGNNQWHFTNDSFDDCQEALTATSGPEIIDNTNDHFEEPNAGANSYPFITMPSTVISNTIVDFGNDFQLDNGSGTAAEYINNGGNVTSDGDVLTSGPNVVSSTQDFIVNQDIGDHVSWQGLTNVSSSVIDVVGTTLYSPQGYQNDANGAVLYISNTTSTNPSVGIGTGKPQNTLDVNGTGDFRTSLSVGTTTSSTYLLEVGTSTNILTVSSTGQVQINSNNLVDASGNKYSTSTNFGTVTTSSAGTANTLPIWTSASALGLSNISSPTATTTYVNASATYIGTNASSGPFQFTSTASTTKSYVEAGSSTVAATIGGTLAYSATSTGNGAGASTTIETFTIPTSTFLTVGDEVDFYVGGTYSSTSATNKQVQATVSSTVIFDTGTSFAPANAACNWFLEGRGLLISAASTTWVTQYTDSCQNALTDDSGDAGNKTVAITTTSSTVIKIYGNGTNASDTIANYFRVLYDPF